MPPVLRLYRFSETQTALVSAPATLFDPERGFDWVRLAAVGAVDAAGEPRLQGEPPRPNDGVLFDATLKDLSAVLQASRPALGEPLVFDLRDRSGVVAGIRVRVNPASSLRGRTLTDLRFRQRYWAVVTALWHDGQAVARNWGDHPLAAGDEFVALGRRKRVEELTRLADLEVVAFGCPQDPGIDQQVLGLSVPAGSALVGASLRSGSLGGLVELSIIGIRRRGEPRLAISQEDPIRIGDPLLAVGGALQVLSLLQRGLVAAADEVPEGAD